MVGRTTLEKKNKALLHKKILAYTRRTRASKADGRRPEQQLLASARKPQLCILLLAGDLSKVASSRFQESSAFQTIVNLSDERTKFSRFFIDDLC